MRDLVHLGDHSEFVARFFIAPSIDQHAYKRSYLKRSHSIVYVLHPDEGVLEGSATTNCLTTTSGSWPRCAKQSTLCGKKRATPCAVLSGLLLGRDGGAPSPFPTRNANRAITMLHSGER